MPALPPEVDGDEQGTHIAGVAASNGRATSGTYPRYRYVGIAPEADLVSGKSRGESQITHG